MTNPNYENLFEASKTFIMASLGNFDLYQYDITDDWKRYYGIFLHLAVLFSNMILMINLLIAIMSDTYSSLSEVRTGLYWAQVIKEMPKLAHDKYYGSLAMFPFPFGWLSIISMPFLLCSNNKDWLESVNNVFMHIVYFPVMLVLLVIFITVNLVLIPIAYLKTIAHKIALLSRFKSAN